MALDFPSNPINGQVYDNFIYDSIKGTWKSLSSGASPSILTSPTIINAVISATAPNSTTVPLTVNAAASQSANLQEWKNNAGVQLASIDGSGNLNNPSTTSTNIYSTNLYLNRQNTVNEGGQINFRRASDNADSWYIDSYGSTSTPSLRFINNSNVSMEIDGSGRITTPYQPSFLAYSNTGTAYKAAGSWEDISRLKTSGGVATVATRYNIGNHFDTATGRFTAPVTGQYVFYAGGWASYNGAGNRYAISFTTNNLGTNYISGANYSIADSPLAMSPVVLNLAANDYVILQMFSSVATTLGTGSHFFYYGGYLLG